MPASRRAGRASAPVTASHGQRVRDKYEVRGIVGEAALGLPSLFEVALPGFRAAMRRKGRETQFKALLYPAGNYICIAFLAMILVLMCTIDDMRLSALLLPVWVIFLFAAFKLSRKK